MNTNEIKRLDYRKNLIIDQNNPILIQKAWRDHFSDHSHWNAGYGGEAYLGRKNSEDALTWNTFRSLQLVGEEGYSILSEFLKIDSIETIMFWGMDISSNFEYQLILNSLIRYHDGHFRGTMTEPDIVIVTKREVVFIECKLNNNGTTSPWKAQSEGSRKRYNYYTEIDKEILKISEWETVYQLIRNIFYAKEMAKILNREPLVIPLVNDKHKVLLSRIYQPIKKGFSILREIHTWQCLAELLGRKDDKKYSNIIRKVKEAI